MTTVATMLTFFGLRFHPFLPEIPVEAIYASAPVELFCRRIEGNVAAGGFSAVLGQNGAGKSVILRYMAHRFQKAAPDIVVARIDHPQSSVANFYRELGDIFGVSLSMHNRFAGFKDLRNRWLEHVQSRVCRPILIIDEAQDLTPQVVAELRSLASIDFDSRSLLCTILAGDQRLQQRFKDPDMLPLATRIRRRLQIDAMAPEDLRLALDHVLDVACAPALITSELKHILAEQSLGNFRVMMNSCEELLLAAFERQRPILDEQLFFDLFSDQIRKPVKKSR